MHESGQALNGAKNSVIRTKNQELKYQIIQAFCGEIEIEPILDLCAECHKNQIETVANIIERHEKEISEISDNNLIVIILGFNTLESHLAELKEDDEVFRN